MFVTILQYFKFVFFFSHSFKKDNKGSRGALRNQYKHENVN